MGDWGRGFAAFIGLLGVGVRAVSCEQFIHIKVMLNVKPRL